MKKSARTIALLVGVVMIILGLINIISLNNEGLLIAVFLCCWGLDFNEDYEDDEE
jgi:uncharacterized membrane protein YiaA